MAVWGIDFLGHNVDSTEIQENEKVVKMESWEKSERVQEERGKIFHAFWSGKINADQADEKLSAVNEKFKPKDGE